MTRCLPLASLLAISGCFVAVNMGGQDAGTTGAAGSTSGTTSSGGSVNVDCTPNPVDFGPVVVDVRPEPILTVTCTNSGTTAALLSLNAAGTAAVFDVTDANGAPISASTPQTLPPGGSYSFDVAFEPNAIGSFTSSVDVTVCASAVTCVQPLPIALNGIGVASGSTTATAGSTTVGASGAASTSGSGTTSGTTANSTSSGTGTASTGGSASGGTGNANSSISCTPDTIDFGGVPAGSVDTQGITCTNNGTEPAQLTVSANALSAQFTASDSVGPLSSSTSQTLAADGGTYVFSVAFFANGMTGSFTSDLPLSVCTGDGGCLSEQVELEAVGIDGSGCELEIRPSNLDFGTVTLGTPVVQAATLTNGGAANCEITNVFLDPQSDPSFTLDAAQANNFTIVSSQSATITVDFTLNNSSTPSQRTGVVYFSINDPDVAQLAIPLTATISSLVDGG